VAKKSENNTTKAARTTGNERADFVGYVNVTLTDADKPDFEGWNVDGVFPLEAFLDALELGYQFTTKFDAENECFSCSVSSWNKSRDDAGIIYTARSDDPEKARLKAIYVWDRKLARNLWNGHVKGQRRDAF